MVDKDDREEGTEKKGEEAKEDRMKRGERREMNKGKGIKEEEKIRKGKVRTRKKELN